MAVIYLLVWYPPVQSGRDVVGGWEVEAWHGADCDWSIALAELGASYWVGPDLAQAVATRALHTRLITVDSWRPCGSSHAPMFVAHRSAPSPVAIRPVALSTAREN